MKPFIPLVALLFILPATSWAAKKAAPKPRRPPPGHAAKAPAEQPPAAAPFGCVASAPGAERELAAADAAAEKAFKAAIKAKKFVPVELSGEQRVYDQNHDLGEVLDLDGAKHVVGWIGSEYSDNQRAEFAWMTKGKLKFLVLLRRQPEVTSQKEYTICGCGPVGQGAVPRKLAIAFPLPKGAVFKGVEEVAYKRTVVKIWHSEHLADETPCPQPP